VRMPPGWGHDAEVVSATPWMPHPFLSAVSRTLSVPVAGQRPGLRQPRCLP
jgi:hypothetical protein